MEIADRRASRDGPTDHRRDGRTNAASFSDARTRLKNGGRLRGNSFRVKKKVFTMYYFFF
jgi:hypothetical protein